MSEAWHVYIMLPIFDFMRVIFIYVVVFVSAVIDEVSYTLFIIVRIEIWFLLGMQSRQNLV